MYKKLLGGTLANGVVTVEQRKSLERFRAMRFIRGDTHDKCLDELGWTKAEYMRGRHEMSDKEMAQYEHLRRLSGQRHAPSYTTRG